MVLTAEDRQHRIHEFVQALIPIQYDIEAIEALCEEELEFLRTQTAKPSTLKTYLSYYRNAIKQQIPMDANNSYTRPIYNQEPEQWHNALKFLILTPEEQTALSYGYKEQVANNNRSQISLSATKSVSKALSVISNHRLGIAARATALSFLSGRRAIELYSTGTFTYINDSRLLFEGQAKDRNDESSDYEIPILGNAAQTCIDTITLIRAKYPQLVGIDYKAFNSSQQSALNKAYANYLKVDIPGSSFKTLRAAYGCVTYALMPIPGYSKNAHLAAVLGHSRNDLATASSYDIYQVI